MGDEVMRAGDGDSARARRAFWALWTVVLLAKLAVAARLPLFVDEAFYWQEGHHLAPAYSDLPGLTAWLARLGVTLGGEHAFALRLPFLCIAAVVPLLLVRLTAREFGERHGWVAGCFALLLPLSGTLGLLALPDAMLALATVLCADAGARLLREVSATAALELALGLAVGALSHYRFIAVIGVGLVALLLLPDGRRALRDVRVWVAVAVGASAWAPLVAWNVDNADAGLRFQLVDRHPWSFHADGVLFIAIQALLVTPLLFAALAHAGRKGLSGRLPASRYFALSGGLVVAGFFVLGFFADTERVSFHWPLPGYLALLPLLPATLAAWPRPLRATTWGLAALGLIATLGYYVAVSSPQLRAWTATEKWYPSNFAGWDELAAEVRRHRATMPTGTRIVADNFKVGAELGFALGDPDIPVLDHPLNRKHGRAPQLRLWGLELRELQGPALLVVGASDVKLRDLLAHYQQLCHRVGPLPPPRVVNVDHGSQRFLLFALPAERPEGACVTPVLAHVARPAPGSRVPARFRVSGWAFKDGVGVAAVTITLDGKPVARARYGEVNGWPQAFFGDRSTDPNQPAIGFSVDVDASALAPGRHWLGIDVQGNDGSREAWMEHPVSIESGG